MKYDILIANDVETKRAGKDQKEDFGREASSTLYNKGKQPDVTVGIVSAQKK